MLAVIGGTFLTPNKQIENGVLRPFHQGCGGGMAGAWYRDRAAVSEGVH